MFFSFRMSISLLKCHHVDSLKILTTSECVEDYEVILHTHLAHPFIFFLLNKKGKELYVCHCCSQFLRKHKINNILAVKFSKTASHHAALIRMNQVSVLPETSSALYVFKCCFGNYSISNYIEILTT